MTVTDVWKIHKIGVMKDVSISQFADELAYDMIAYAATCNDELTPPPNNVCLTVDTSSTSLLSLTVPTKEDNHSTHTQSIIHKKQICCIWCS